MFEAAGARLIVTKPTPRKRPNDRHLRKGEPSARNEVDGRIWLWGNHAVQAALANADRVCLRLVATGNAARRCGLEAFEEMAAGAIDRLLPQGAVHQGIALQTKPLQAVTLDEMIARDPQHIVVLDQVSDPHNLGAIIRSAAAFGIGGIVLQTRHAPPMTGIVAKTAAGGVDTLPECRVVNIARALDGLAEAGYAVIGLAGEGRASLASVLEGAEKAVLVLGAEGAGLRPAVAKACTYLAKIPMSPAMESLNVSNAAAIAFYEASRNDFS